MQKVTVTGWADQKKVLKAARKTGRRVELWPFPYTTEYNAYTEHYYHQHQPSQSFGSFSSQPASTYNYYKHGYDGNDHGYYHRAPHSTIINDRAGAMFSDDNPNACSIM